MASDTGEASRAHGRGLDQQRQRRGLRQEAVVAAAAKVARHGIEQVTMAAVARELGVTAMALYVHVRDKQHLMTLLLDSLLAEIDVPPSSLEPWDERLRHLHRDVTAAMTRYPGLVLEAGEPREVPRLLNGYLQILLDAGFDDRTAALAYTGLYYLAMGAQQPYHGARGTPAALPPADPTMHVATARTSTAVAGVDLEELQHFALDVYIEGLSRLIRSATS